MYFLALITTTDDNADSGSMQIGFVGLFNEDIVVLLLFLPCHARCVAQSVQMGCLQSWV